MLMQINIHLAEFMMEVCIIGMRIQNTRIYMNQGIIQAYILYLGLQGC